MPEIFLMHLLNLKALGRHMYQNYLNRAYIITVYKLCVFPFLCDIFGEGRAFKMSIIFWLLPVVRVMSAKRDKLQQKWSFFSVVQFHLSYIHWILFSWHFLALSFNNVPLSSTGNSMFFRCSILSAAERKKYISHYITNSPPFTLRECHFHNISTLSTYKYVKCILFGRFLIYLFIF